MRLPFHASPLTGAYALAAVLAGLVTAALGLGWPHHQARHSGASPLIGPPLRAFATFPEGEAFFGDVVSARVEVLVDRSRFRTEPVVRARFAPFSVVGRATSRESLGRGVEREVTTFRLRCLGAECVPPASSHRTFQFPAVSVTPSGGGPVARAAWHPLVVVSRTYGDGLRTAGLRSPSAVSGHGTEWLSAALWATGASAVLAAVLLGGWGLVRRRPQIAEPAPSLPPSVDPVLAACGYVRDRLAENVWARQRGALDVLARALEASGSASLAQEARALAWQRERARADDVDDLLDRVLRRGELSQDDEPQEQAA